MSHKGTDAATVAEVYQRTGSKRATARELKIHPKTVAWHLGKHFDIPELPEKARPIEQILADRKDEFSRRAKYEDARALVPIRVKINGPVAIVHTGDPHIDDAGCDIQRLEDDLTTIRETDGMLAVNVGDYSNNWIGRLARLYSEETVTAEERWKLVEWMFALCKDKWLYLVGGNHDAWSGGADPLHWLAKQQGAWLQYHGARISLVFPNKREVRVNTRHDFRGGSIWNPAHGPMKAAQIAFRDHILTCGHKHYAAYGMVPNPDLREPLVSHCIRVGAYKIHDDYATALGFFGGPPAPAAVTIIDPTATDPYSLVRVLWNVQEAAEYLKFLRR